MIDTVFVVRDALDNEIHSIFSNEEDAEQFVKNNPYKDYLMIQAYVLHHKLT